MIRSTSVAIACALAFSATTSAFAASQSSASITGLTFTLIDLKPRDGIAPSFSFLNSVGSTVLSVNATDNFVGESDSASRTRVGTFSFTRSYLTDIANAEAHSAIASNTLTASGSAFGAQTTYSAGASTGASTNSYYYYGQPLNLSLSANTVLLIDADVSLSAAASNPQSCGYYCYGASESASASASMSLTYSYSGTGVSTSYSANQSLSLQAVARGATTNYNYVYNPSTGWYDYVYTTVPKTEEDKSLNDVLSGVFTNSSSTTQFASLGLSVSASGHATSPKLALPLPFGGGLPSSPSAVPEPESYAMGLAGMGVLGLLLRRRRSLQA